MGLKYSKIKQSEGVMRSLTGLTLAQFDKLVPAFEHPFEKRYSKYNLLGALRQRNQSKKASDQLPEAEEKLFFILTYVKSYPAH